MAQVNSILCTGSAKFLNKIYGACTDGTSGTTKYMRQDGTWQVPPNDQFTLGISGTQQIVLSKNGTAQTPITVPYATTAGSATPTSHTHGNIQNGGTLQTTDVAIASGDKLVITDSSDSSKVARSSLAFSAAVSSQSQSTKFLREDGSWAAPSYTTNTDRYVNSASFADDSTNTSASPVKMTLTRAGSDTATVTANIPKVSSTSAGVVPKGASVSSQTTSTKFLREDGSWAAPSYPTVNNGTLTISRNGVSVGTFTANQSSAASANINCITSVSASDKGIESADVESTGGDHQVSIGLKLKSDTASTLDSASMGSTSSRQYAVGLDKSGYLSVNIPWSDNNNAVTQTATSTNANYEVLFSATADNTTRTEGARKYSNLTFNPSTGTLTSTILTSGTVNADTANITEDNVGNLIVTGAARFLNTINGSVSGNAANVTGTVAIANGGTGAATAANARTNLGLGSAATKNTTDSYAPAGTDVTTGKAITAALQTLDGAITGSAGASKTLTAFSQTDGIVSATFSDISISKSQVSDFPTSLPASNTVDTYDSTSGDPISGKGVADALASLPSPTGGTVTSVTIKGTSPIVSSSSDAITTSGTRTISHANSGVTAGTYKSVTVNATGHVTAGTNPTTLAGYGITDAKIASGTITLGSNTITPLTSSSTLDSTKLSGTIPTSCYTNTKNTAGSTDTSSKIFLIGATSQDTNPQTYSQDTAYVGTDGCLYSGGTKVLTSHQDISGKLNRSGDAITGTLYSQTSGANFEVYSPAGDGHKMRFTATDTPRSGIYDIVASQWAFWKDADGFYRIGPYGYATQVRSQAKGSTTYNLAWGIVIGYRYTASTTNATVAYISQWTDGGSDNVVYQHHVSTINVAVYVSGTSIQVQNNTNGNIQVVMIGKFCDA